MTATTTDTVAALARAFAVGLRNQLSAKVLAAIDAENAARGDNSCASHDWLDANEVMANAFAAVTGHAPSPSSSEDCELMNAAWGRAKATGYAVLAREPEVRP
jgi:hypothetical protein